MGLLFCKRNTIIHGGRPPSKSEPTFWGRDIFQKNRCLRVFHKIDF